jgi:hypothetical protein
MSIVMVLFRPRITSTKDVKAIVGNPIGGPFTTSSQEQILPRTSPGCPDRLKRISTDRTEIAATGNNAPPKIGRIVSPTRNSYTRKLPELEPLFAYFTRKKLPRKAISEIADDMRIAVNTLDDWRRKLKNDARWRPECLRSAGHRALTDEQEETRASVIRTEFIENGIYCPRRYLNLLAIRIPIDAEASPTTDLPCDRGRRIKALIRSVDRESQFLEEIDQQVDSDESDDEITDAVEDDSWESEPEGGTQDPEAVWQARNAFRSSNH